MPLSTQCPHCDKIMKLKSEAFLGKKVSCPKCGEEFKIKRYEEPEVVEDDYEDASAYEEYDEYEEEEERPARRSNSRSRSAKKPKAKRPPEWLKPAAIGLVVLLGLGGVVGLGMAVVPKLMGRNVVDLSYMPAQVDALIYFEPGKIWNAPMLGAVRNLPQVQEAIKESSQGFNMTPVEIESVTIGMMDVADLHQIRPFGGGFGPVVKRADPKFIAVVRTTKDIDDQFFSQVQSPTKDTHQGQSITVGRQDGKTFAYWIANPRICVIGGLAEVKASIDQGASAPRIRRFDFITKGQQFFIAMAPEKVAPKLPTGGAVSASQRFSQQVDEHVRGGSFGFTMGSDVDFTLQLQCFSSSGAGILQKEFDTHIADAKAKSASLPSVSHAGAQTLLESGKELVNSLKASKSGSSLTLQVKVPGKIVGAIQQIADDRIAAWIALAPVLAKFQGGGGAGQPMGTPGMTTPSSTTQP